jgi:phosphotriesterase-related protein
MDIDRDLKIAGSGAFVAYDNIGVEAWSTKPYAMPDDKRAEQVSTLLKAGFQDQLLLSAGSIAFGLGWSEAHVSSVGNLLRYFAPQLAAAGIDEAVVNAILCDNPQRVLPLL